MNLSKITIPVISLVSIISLSTCVAAGTAEIMKKQLLQQVKLLQLSQSQPGKSLRKAASASKEITVADSVQTYSWGNSSWEKSGSTRYSYDSKGRIKEEIKVDETDGSDSRNSFEYDSDGKTIKNTSIWNLSVDGELFMSETTYSLFKYYPGYSSAILQSNFSEYTALIDLKNTIEFYGLDSLLTMTFDAAMDTTFKSVTRYSKISNKIVRANITFASISDVNELMSYHVDYITSGNDVSDTLKCIYHFDTGVDSLYEQLLSEMQYTMVVSKTKQDRTVEQTIVKAKDSTFTSFSNDSKMYYYVNATGDVDSMVTQEWDTLAQVWENSEKVVYTLKNVNVGVEKSTNTFQVVQQITFDRKNGTLYLDIPSGMTVSEIEQLDLQGRILSRSAVPKAKNSIALGQNLKGSSVVNLIRLKTSNGNVTCKISSVR